MIPIAALDDMILGVMRGARGASGFSRRHPMLGAFRGTLPFILPFVAYEAATAPRGESGSKAAGITGGFVASTAAYGLTDHLVKKAILGSVARRRTLASVVGRGTLGPASKVAKAFLGLPAMVAATAAAWAVDSYVAPRVEATTKAVLRDARLLHHFSGGGEYQDTEAAYTMRQRAVQELSTSLLNARQYFGREATLLHQ